MQSLLNDANNACRDIDYLGRKIGSSYCEPSKRISLISIERQSRDPAIEDIFHERVVVLRLRF